MGLMVPLGLANRLDLLLTGAPALFLSHSPTHTHTNYDTCTGKSYACSHTEARQKAVKPIPYLNMFVDVFIQQELKPLSVLILTQNRCLAVHLL